MSFASFIAAQAAAEYTAITAHNAAGAPQDGLKHIVDGAREYLASHILVAVVGAVAFLVVYRFVFASPRVR